MKVALFFDGKNFYSAFRQYVSNREIDYDRLAKWLIDEASGGTGELVGAYYYTGYSPPDETGSASFRNFLEGLELRLGYFIKREPRVGRKGSCPKCKAEYDYSTEKRVDTRLVADMIQLAAVDAYDAAVLLSGDQDFVPAVEAANALGKRVYIATWPSSGVSKELRVRCYGQIPLANGLTEFSTGRALESHDTTDLLPEDQDPQTNMTREISLALDTHPYLSRGFFINKWRPQSSIPEAGHAREEMLDALILEGKVIEDVTDDTRGGRSVRILTLPSIEQ